ncbi:MAG: hypothetical protein ACKO7W_11055 [Elainella sp.]
MTSSVEQLIEFATAVANALEACGSSYYVAHGLTDLLLGQSAVQGNLVLVAALQPEQAEQLVSRLSRFHIEPADVVQSAAGDLGGFGIVHPQHHQIAEVWRHPADEFSCAKMARRQSCEIGGLSLWLCSPEDAILDKLILEQGGRSGQRWTGLLEILRTQAAGLDYTYLGEWAARLGVSPVLSWALIEAEI